MNKIVNKIVNQLLTTFFAAAASACYSKADKYKRSLIDDLSPMVKLVTKVTKMATLLTCKIKIKN